LTNKTNPDNFYLNVTQIGDRIFHKHYNSLTKQKVLDVIEEFPIDLYIKNSKNPDFKGLYGEKLKTVSFNSLKNAREYIKTNSHTHTIHGQEKFVYQFIRNKYPNDIKFDITKFNICNIDIENIFQDGGPNPSTADAPIIAITLKLFGEKNKFITLGLTDYIDQHENTLYIKCKDEAQLLTKFIKVWNKLNIDILTGYYIGGYDIPYLVNRINMILGNNA